MSRNICKVILCSAVVGLAATEIARADCERDLIQLEQAFKTPNLAPSAKAALDEARPVAVAALKKDDDATCHKAIVDGMTKAGMTLK
jgi:hypothetical protein